jgi:hypothetical protein
VSTTLALSEGSAQAVPACAVITPRSPSVTEMDEH